MVNPIYINVLQLSTGTSCHYASTAQFFSINLKPRKRDAAYLQQQLQIVKRKKQEVIQSTQFRRGVGGEGGGEEEGREKVGKRLECRKFMAAEMLMKKLERRLDNATVYDSDGSNEFGDSALGGWRRNVSILAAMSTWPLEEGGVEGRLGGRLGAGRAMSCIGVGFFGWLFGGWGDFLLFETLAIG
ncbi:hypothetical protein Tco_0309450 [Tanacetum coccineum]